MTKFMISIQVIKDICEIIINSLIILIIYYYNKLDQKTWGTLKL
jgi:hypothetical protein